MPRSYSFDHFQVPAAAPEGRTLRRKSKQAVSDTRHAVYEELGQQEGGVHYGHSHAETEARYQAHARERQLEPLTPAPEHATTKFSHGRPAREMAPAAPAVAREVEPPKRRSTVPIGAVPNAEELPPRGVMQDLLDDASRQVQVLQTGLEDATRAASRLASLPLEALRLAARRLRLVHG